MATYKVSYKVLSQQGETLKALGKEVDSYVSRVDSVRSRLGNDNLLATVRQNLQKLSQQLGESRMALNMASDVVEKCVSEYSNMEVTVVKKVDSVKAHNRDFYKRPVVVASAGAAASAVSFSGAATGVSSHSATGGSVSPGASSTVENLNGDPAMNVTFSESNKINYKEVNVFNGGQTAAEPVQAPKSVSTGGNISGGVIGAAAGAGGIAAGVAGLYGAQRLKKYLDNKKQQNAASETVADRTAYYRNVQDQELEERLIKAREEAAKYQETDTDQ